MGKCHDDTLCNVFDPSYDRHDFFTVGDLGFSQMCLGPIVRENEELFERIIDKVHNHADCRDRYDGNRDGPCLF